MRCDLAASDCCLSGYGKGRANWIAFGYVLATQKARVVATHDCDILDYQRDLLARLCYPTANPNMSYEFAKGYYSRVSDRMHGRVTRLFMTPIMRAMKSVLGQVPLLEYLDSFRYPLAGECSMTTELVRANRIPADWGLEVGVLAEVYRNCSLKRICQVICLRMALRVSRKNRNGCQDIEDGVCISSSRSHLFGPTRKQRTGNFAQPTN